MVLFLIIMIVAGPILLVLYDRGNYNKEGVVLTNFLYTLIAVCMTLGSFAKDPNFGDFFNSITNAIGLVLIFESIALWIVGFQMIKPISNDIIEKTDNLGIVDIGNLSIYIPKQKYNGKPICINEGDITVVCGESILKSKTDYYIKPNSYLNNIEKGEATLILVGKGEYEGEYMVPFIID